MDELGRAVYWYAKATKKLRLWASLVRRYTGQIVSKRDWKDYVRSMDLEPGDPGPDYDEYLTGVLTREAYGDAEVAKIAKDFAKRTGIDLDRLMESWKMAGKPN
jgi:hypothetical protein